MSDESSTLQHTLGVFGTLVAGTFLIVIGLMNLSSLFGIVHIYRHMKAGTFDEEHLEHHLHNRGFIARIFKRTMQRVSKPWHLYPVGLLMGLGFDTATQVALLVLAGGTAAFALPWYAILVLPVLFTAGMTLFDTVDGVFMAHAYRWAFLKPDPQDLLQLHGHRAVGHGRVRIGADRAHPARCRGARRGSRCDWAARIDLEYVGFALVGAVRACLGCQHRHLPPCPHRREVRGVHFMSDRLAVGDKAPDFTLTNDAGDEVTLSSLRGKRSSCTSIRQR